MRAIFILLSAVMLFVACSPHHPAPATDASVSAKLPSDFRPKVEAMSKLEKVADVILEAQGSARFRLLKPSIVGEPSVTGLDGYLRLISPRSVPEERSLPGPVA